MSGRLAGKTALITGAAQGIGRATALAWAEEGARVIATDRNPDAFAGLDQTSGIALATLDVTDGGAIDAAAAEHGALDILFNCAGWVAEGTLLDASRQDLDQSLAINVTSMFQMIRAFLPAMRANGHGVIVNMASIASSEMGVVNRCAYSVSKAAVIGLTKSVAADYVGDGIRCNAICPATVETPSLNDRINAADDPAQARRDFLARQKMGRLAEPEEIAELATYLASDGASYVTGQTILIDGGMRI